jgi:TRAP-type C4-dicarboxylate transport system permease small subunit
MSLLKEGRMKYFWRILNRISILERNMGAVCLTAVMVIICANVAYRVIGGIIPGTFDLVELLIVPAVGFALVTVELAKRHTIVDMVTTHLPTKVRSWVEICVTIIALFYWTVICWATWGMLLKKMATGEHTQLLQVSVIPFRIIWIFALVWLCGVIVLNIGKLFKEIGEQK